jgi:hypothetical protein
VAALQPEAPYKLINYFKDMARGHALIHGRRQVTISDLTLISEVAVSSIPGYLRPLVRELRRCESVDTTRCQQLCRVSDTSARRYMKELQLLGLAVLIQGDSRAVQANRIALAEPFAWLRIREN